MPVPWQKLRKQGKDKSLSATSPMEQKPLERYFGQVESATEVRIHFLVRSPNLPEFGTSEATASPHSALHELTKTTRNLHVLKRTWRVLVGGNTTDLVEIGYVLIPAITTAVFTKLQTFLSR